MNFNYLRNSSIIACLFATAILTGCATSRDTVTPQIDAGNNPSKGIAVRIDNIEDARHFEVRPSDPSIPSLKDGDISNKALCKRAIARKRNTYGMALGDVLLPEGQSVAKLTQSAMARSFREAGYRVVSPQDPDYAKAIPITAKIKKLWAWMSPGFWAMALQSKYDITIDAPLDPIQKGVRVRGQVRNSMQFATAEDWSKIVKKSLDDFSNQLTEELSQK